LKAKLKLFGTDSDVDILVSLVTHATIEYLRSTLLNNGSLISYRIISQIANSCSIRTKICLSALKAITRVLGMHVYSIWLFLIGRKIT